MDPRKRRERGRKEENASPGAQTEGGGDTRSPVGGGPKKRGLARKESKTEAGHSA